MASADLCPAGRGRPFHSFLPGSPCRGPLDHLMPCQPLPPLRRNPRLAPVHPGELPTDGPGGVGIVPVTAPTGLPSWSSRWECLIIRVSTERRMSPCPGFPNKPSGSAPKRLEELMERTAQEARERICRHPKRVLLLPPDITRAHSGAGRLTELLYQHFAGQADVHVIPTLGQHVPHTPEQNRRMFGSIPNERIHAHDWRGGCVKLGRGAGRLRRASRPAAWSIGRSPWSSTGCSWRAAGTW